jgi:dihydroorotase-like cyclic amidohydrolase
VGKDADLCIWDPTAKRNPTEIPGAYPECSPYLGETLYGVVHVTYIRGRVVYGRTEAGLHAIASGQILTKA